MHQNLVIWGGGCQDHYLDFRWMDARGAGWRPSQASGKSGHGSYRPGSGEVLVLGTNSHMS